MEQINQGIIESDECFQISDSDIEDYDDVGDDLLLDGFEEPTQNVSNNVRGPYERAWTTEATRALIHVRGPMEERFTEGRQKRTALWVHCTRKLQKMGYRYSAAKVQKKWHNILITYHKNLSKKYLSGYVHWEFFEEMYKYLQGKKFDLEILHHQHQQQQQQHSNPQQAQIIPIEQGLKLQQQQPAHINNAPQPQQQVQQNQHIKLLIKEPEQINCSRLLLDSKSNDDFDDDSNSVISELKQPKLELNGQLEGTVMSPMDIFEAHENHNFTSEREQQQQQHLPHHNKITGNHNAWWQDYFERKLQVEREKIELQRDMHRDVMNFNKVSSERHEKVERAKINAINTLNATIQQFIETNKLV